MSSATENPLDELRSLISALAKPILSSFLLSTVALGVLLLVLGQTVIDGVVAGMFGIWGVSLILTAGSAYAIIEFKKR